MIDENEKKLIFKRLDIEKENRSKDWNEEEKEKDKEKEGDEEKEEKVKVIWDGMKIEIRKRLKLERIEGKKREDEIKKMENELRIVEDEKLGDDSKIDDDDRKRIGNEELKEIEEIDEKI